MNKTYKKEIEPVNDVCIRFTEEEMQEMGLQAGDKFSVEQVEDGFMLQKYGKLEIDLEDWDREILELLIKESCEQDRSVNDVLGDLLRTGLERLDAEEAETIPTEYEMVRPRR